MSTLARRALIGLLCATASLDLAAPAVADRAGEPGGDDHDAARDAVAHGEALPLADILARVGPALGGQVIGVHFERRGGRWLYEFRVLANGQLRVVHVDAATADIVRSEVR
jgi:uncharacterized membrane protein YkoI